MTPIAVVRSPRSEAEDDFWGAVESRIEMIPGILAPDALDGLASFSHVEVVFVFDRVDPSRVCWSARHPRGNEAWPRVGILAQRAKDRPNRIGVSRAEIVRVDGEAVVVRGLDAIDGTPVLDIKPMMREFEARGEVRQPEWATELMRDYYEING